ncbi:hypothetical protein [Crocosphaera chwakensis]|uniref:Uncharacterized protein n=1 Tax=Crocosphaera chwakensis CCY0110 TaxID=391612 RepID=A3IZ03_9CHRO|nr:hypothetical protein [Crocosphaera chwakensis]EAZ88304.1 hypothetical protein CY0110_14400 [Crocosphaera chwakensis CCY0110]
MKRKEKFLEQLIEPSDGLKLVRGLRLDKRITSEMLSEDNVINASEVLIEINESDNLFSQTNLISRALDYGWTPLEYEEKICEVKKKTKVIIKKVIVKNYLLRSLSLIISLIFLFIFPTIASYFLSFTIFAFLPLPLLSFPFVLFSNQDIFLETWQLLGVIRFEPDYIINLKHFLYIYFDFVVSNSDDQILVDIYNQLSPTIIADIILFMFLMIVTLTLPVLSYFVNFLFSDEMIKN